MDTNPSRRSAFKLHNGPNERSCWRSHTAGTNQKEVKIGWYFVDGMDEQAKIIYKNNGCVFNGHPESIEKEDLVPFSYLTIEGSF